MVKFNPETAAEGQNYLGYSRGQEPNNAMEALFKGGAQVVEGAAKVADDNIQSNIKKDVYREYDAANDSFGVDANATIGGATTGPGNGATPDEITDAKDYLDRLKNGFSNGSIPESHYWGRLEDRVKGLRMKYPGYRDQIDAIVQDVTGGNPANILRNQMFEEINKLNAANAEGRNKIDGFIMNNARYASANLWNKYENGDTSVKESLIADIQKNMRRDQEISDRHAENTLTTSDREVYKQKFDDDLQKDGAIILDKQFDNVMTALGNTLPEQLATIDRMSKAGPGGADVLAVTQTLAGLEANMTAALTKHLNEIGPDGKFTYAQAASEQGIKNYLGQVQTRLAAIKGLVTNGDYGFLKQQALAFEAQKTKVGYDLVQRIPGLLEAQQISAIGGGPMWDRIMMQSKAGSAMAKVLGAHITASFLTGNIGSVEEAFAEQQKLGGSEVKPQDLHETMLTPGQIMRDKDTPPAIREKQIDIMYGEANGNFLENIAVPERLAAWKELTSPENTAAVLELAKNKPELLDKYQTWAANSFHAIFKSRGDQINKDFAALGEAAHIVFDEKDAKFRYEIRGKLKEDPNEGPVSALNRQEDLKNMADNSIGELNRYFANLQPIVEANHGSIAHEARDLMDFLGIKLELDSETPEKSNDFPEGTQDSSDNSDLSQGLHLASSRKMSDNALSGHGSPDDLGYAQQGGTEDSAAQQAITGNMRASGSFFLNGVDINNTQQVPISGGSEGSRSFGGPRGHGKLHTGVDVPAPDNSPIHATGRGRVVRAGQGQGYGTVVDVEYEDGTVHRYAHLRKADVKEGDMVSPGQEIARSGHSGNANAGFPHVHYEIFKSGWYHKHGGRPMGRAANRVELNAGRIDPRVYWKNSG